MTPGFDLKDQCKAFTTLVLCKAMNSYFKGTN